MNNSGVVSGRLSTRHIHCKIAGLPQTHGTTAKAITQGFALQQLGNDVRRSVVLAHVEDRNNIGMVESGGGLRLQFKATETIRVPRPESRTTLIATSRFSDVSRARTLRPFHRRPPARQSHRTSGESLRQVA